MLRIPSTLAVAALLGACAKEPATEPAKGPADATPQLASAPLRDREAGAGPRFRRLDPAATGLAFTNELRRENVVPYVYIGAGVATGDYDGDGMLDVFLASQDGANKLFRQTAPMRFEDVTAAAGGLGGGDAWGTAAVFADVDGDRDLDLYVCNLESGNLLYLNQGDGTFREGAAAAGVDLVAASTGVAFADYDNDGDLDLYVLTNRLFGPLVPTEIVAGVTLPKDVRKTRTELFPPYPKFEKDGTGALVVPKGYEDLFATIGERVFPAGQRDRLFRNDGRGRFTDVTTAAGLDHHGNGLSVVFWDCDDDGWLDLYVANDLHSPDKLYRNLGDGRFADITAQALPHTAFFGMGADFGDLDGDLRLDLCVADMSSTSHYMGKLLMGNMGTHRWFLMNADPPQHMRNTVYLNTGTGRFLEAGRLLNLASTDWTWAVRFADLDEDARLDLFATNGIPLFSDDPDAVRRFDELWAAGQRERALDLYRNLRRIDEKNIARRNLGDLQFEDVGAAWGLDEAGVGNGAVVEDLDGDGDLDVLVNNLNRPASLFENRTAGTHRVAVRLRGTASNAHRIGARLWLDAGGTTQTHLVMPTRGDMSAGSAVAHFGLGAAATIDRLRVRWPSGREQEFADLAADRLYTIREATAAAAAATPPPAQPKAAPWLAPRAAIAARHRERPFDDYAVQPLLPHRLSQLGPGLACGDVDGDGRDDVWLGGAAGQAGTLLRARADGTFAAMAGPWTDDAECEDLGAVFVDGNGDGALDLYVASGGVEAMTKTGLLQDRLYLNDGKGGFRRAAPGTLPDDAISDGCVAAADFDRDGDVDLFVGGRVVPGRFPEAPPSRLLRNDGGRFVDATDALAPQLRAAGMVSAAVWTDLDDDGWPDLAVAAQWQSVRVHGNQAGARLHDRTTELGLEPVRGQWNGIAAGDLDNDGDMDLVVTNLGLNTKYKASVRDPLRLFARDFDGTGSFDVVEARQTAGVELPVRGLSCSSEAMPFLARAFPTYDGFARATLAEIYGQERLDEALALSVDELRHVVLENRVAAFAAHPLPRLAQIAPGYGVVIADFDGDGACDVAIAHNSFSPEPETGRFDGGLGVVLRNRGMSAFEALPADRSGFVVPGDAKALATLDVDGDADPDLLVATNDGPVHVLAATRAHRGIAVRLAGPPGNPAAIGARVELVEPDGTRQVRELRAGGSYLAQSSAVAFFARAPAGSRVRVRWPDGRATEHPLEATAGVVTLLP
jgi:hypothetical protein